MTSNATLANSLRVLGDGRSRWRNQGQATTLFRSYPEELSNGNDYGRATFLEFRDGRVLYIDVNLGINREERPIAYWMEKKWVEKRVWHSVYGHHILVPSC